MHKGVILLVKATDKEDAIEKVNVFMEPYGNDRVWDWFAIGGRWNNTLAPKDKYDQWKEKAHVILEYKEGDFGISHSKIKDKQPQLQEEWSELGLDGKNPYTDHYKLPDEGNVYDAVPLAECLETVKGWRKDLTKEIEKIYKELVEEWDKRETGKHSSVGYIAKELYNASYGNFCFDSNVYDITEQQAEEIPENIDGYYAVMVDMHT